MTREMMSKAKREKWERELFDMVKAATKAKVSKQVVAKVIAESERKSEQNRNVPITKAKVRQRVVEQVKAGVEESRTESATEVERSTF